MKQFYDNSSVRLGYHAGWEDPPDSDWIEPHAEKIHVLQEAAQMLSPSWLDFTKACLMLQQSPSAVKMTKSIRLSDKKKVSEEDAAGFRAMCRHIRGGRYERQKTGHMKLPPRPETLEDECLVLETSEATKATPIECLVVETSEATEATPNKMLTSSPSVAIAAQASDSRELAESLRPARQLLRMSFPGVDYNDPQNFFVPKVLRDLIKYDPRYIVTWDGAKAFRQLMVNGEAVGAPEPAVNVVTPQKAGSEYVAVFFGGKPPYTRVLDFLFYYFTFLN